MGLDFSKNAEGAAAIILSLEGTVVSEAEAALFKQANPLGFILFARNVENPKQLSALTTHLKEIVGRDCPILIDQEGGRVARMKPPIWRGYPACRTYGAIAENDLPRGQDEISLRTVQIAEELRASGINVNCDPVLDVLRPETHDVIGDRAFSDDPELVGQMGLRVCEDYLRGGIQPIIKHIPGHGRATADSHLELPTVDAPLEDLRALDFVPFSAVARSDIGAAVWAMSAHILYPAIDPDVPLTLSARGIAEIIRGEIGFEGVLISDDVSMKALDAYGDLGTLCARSIEAGCDLALYCAGKLEEMEKIVESVPNLSEDALKRLQNGG